MKKVLNILSVILSLFLTFSCSKTEEPQKPDPKPTPVPTEAVVIDKGVDTRPTINQEGGEAKVSFTATENWTAAVINTKADSWISLDKSSGSAGSAAITITVLGNDSLDDRSATVQIKAGKTAIDIVVSQKGKDALTASASKNEFGPEGGELTIEVKANIDFTYSIAEGCKDWVSESATKAMKTTALKFNVAENEDFDRREGSVSIKSEIGEEVIRIYQSGAEPTIVISQSEYSVKAEGETIQVEVRSNVNVEMAIPEDCDWIKEEATKAFSTNTFYLNVSENVNFASRTAKVAFKNVENELAEEITVFQAGRDTVHVESISLDKTELELTEGDTATLVATVLPENADNKNVIWTSSDESVATVYDGKISAIHTGSVIISAKADDGGFEAKCQMIVKEKVGNVEFEDANFKAFCVDNFDSNGDGEISYSEAAAVLEINCSRYTENGFWREHCGEITSLKGIEFFVNITSLNFQSNYLSSIDLSSNPSLIYLNAGDNRLSCIDVSCNPELKKVYCWGNFLTALDLSNNKKLEDLRCQQNSISSLDISNNESLSYLECTANKIKKLDVSHNTQIAHLICNTNEIDFLDVSSCPSLVELSCADNLLTELNISNNQILKSLYFVDNRISCIDISNCPELSRLSCSSNCLQTLDVTDNPLLESLDCSGNQIQNLDVAHNLLLTDLSCGGNPIGKLDVSNNINLRTLYCSQNNLSTLEVRQCKDLESLFCDFNYLSVLDLSNNLKLRTLSCVDNPSLTEIWLAPGQSIISFNHDEAVTSVKYKGIDDIDNIVAVDLGLSVKWASCNVGTSVPENCGDYFAWGETKTKYERGSKTWLSGFDESSYELCNGSLGSLLKYNTNPENGKVDNISILLPEDDAAHCMLGGNWRMPTIEEWKELIDNCVCTWTTQNGQVGIMAKSTIPGYTDKYIFLPAAGSCNGHTFTNVDYSCSYWSSSLMENASWAASTIDIYSNGVTSIYGDLRFIGRTIRAVTE